MSFSYYDSKLGKIKIEVEDKYIIGVNFVSDVNLLMDEINNENEKKIIIKCKKQLEEYFNGERKNFELEIKFIKGTNFQKSVWNELCKIKFGETVSYKEIAERIGKTNAYRAVGGANNKNPIAIIVPCHRVIGKNGSMVGYADGIDKKEFLLKLERK
ncbi:methylated-DNA--[protein]-cysteine S-methyltransferase [Clostridium sp. D53t1_180928_C8]|uniref:methylated-DNA--[protein]-cysteine S-methyltransferase n=1 Tax=Clostridium sp. D53t1_180928_C8 TaxID=2787101 RepID=UPI0018A8ADE6|nr:methylated-DNA--[protein]-cysteine S-methyltransferase [Clostridium sp. D53t1_180928_C8]